VPGDFLEKFFPRELHFLTILAHPHLIRIHSIMQSGSSVFIFMRCAENGDLLSFIKTNGVVNEAQANLWFYQISSAVKYLHGMSIAHRDLKCDNIFISEHMNIKVASYF
jgi:serine kinase